MATAMNIRLNYGAWPGDDDADTTDTSTTPETSPALYPQIQGHGYGQATNSARRHSSPLQLSDLFSDEGYSIHTQDFLDAERNMTSSVDTATSHPSDSRHRRQHPNLSNLTQTCAPDSSVIDLTLSPPHDSTRSVPAPSGASSAPAPQPPPNMPSTLRNHVQSRRPPPDTSTPSNTEARPRKRRRLCARSTAAEPPQPAAHDDDPEMEAVDLTETKDKSDLSKALSKQQQDAVQAQTKDNQSDDYPGRTPLSSYKCPICMDTPEIATSTVCGHLFCHKCILDTLRFSEQARKDDAGTTKAKGTCPVCRKPLARKDEPGIGRTLVPLEIKLSTRRHLKGKAVAARHGNGAVPARLRPKTERESSEDMWRSYTNLDHS